MNKKNEKIYKIFSTRNGFARIKDILAAGIHRRDIRRMRDGGQIIRVKKGFYRLTEIPLISNQGFIDLARAVINNIGTDKKR